MPVTITCPACNSKLKAPDNLIGKAVKCPTCSKPVMVKAPGAAAPPAPAPVVKKPARPPAPVIEEEEPIDEMEPAEDEVDEPRPRKKGAAAAGLEGPSTDKERSTAMWIYLLPFLVNCCGGVGTYISLFLWISKRKESPFIDHHGKTWLNLTINAVVLTGVMLVVSTVGQVVGGLIDSTVGMIIGGFFGFLTFIVLTYFGVMMLVSGLKAKGGAWYQPKMAFRLLK